jgi:hypothetical protein
MTPERDKRYRDWISSLPCVVCGALGNDPHHTGPHAAKQKASDYTCIPLCRTHHNEYHRLTREPFEARFLLSVAALVEKFNRWYERKTGKPLPETWLSARLRLYGC